MTETTRTPDWSTAAPRWLPPPLDLCDTGREPAAARRPAPGRDRRHEPVPPAADPRYPALLGAAAWASLPPAVCRRFSHKRLPGEVTVYRGAVLACEMNLAGWIVANLARVIGAPLPLDSIPSDDGQSRDPQPTATVVVADMPHAEGVASPGQVWTRSYGRRGTFPQVIMSAKVFTGPTGLEEHLGLGLVMRLTVTAEAGALVFCSAGYHWHIGGWRIAIPAALSPGVAEIVHRAEPDAADRPSPHDFTFTLTLTHPVFGRLVRQVARFTDSPVDAA